MLTTDDLVGILQNWPNINGFDRAYDKVLLSDQLAVQFPMDWAPLVTYCRNSRREDKYRLMFTFATLSFANDTNMDMMRCLIAFSIFEDLKALDPPVWPSYVQFRADHNLRHEYLLQMIRPCCLPYSRDERDIFQGNLNPKQRRKLEMAEIAHEQRLDEDSKVLADFLLSQWPSPQPVIEGFSHSVFIDMTKALDIIRPEWQRLYRNLDLSRYIQNVQTILNRHRGGSQVNSLTSIAKSQEMTPMRSRGDEFPTLAQNLLQRSGPVFGPSCSSGANENPKQIGSIFSTRANYSTLAPLSENTQIGVNNTVHGADIVSQLSPDIVELEDIINSLGNSHSRVRQDYAQDMMQSLNALKYSETLLTGARMLSIQTN